jgi:uncharacterized protein YaiE (UPF0345 family)
MASKIVYSQGRVEVTIPATESIAVYTQGTAQVYRELGYPNVPSTLSLLGTVENEQTVFGAYASGATIIIEAGAAPVYYSVGVGPVTDVVLQAKVQGAPGVLNATGTLTAAMLAAGLVTSTTAAAVTATLDTGTVIDAALDLSIDQSFDWSAINTGGANAFTVTASAGHTIVGSGTVAASSSGHFRTRKTAADTFVTYRL